MLAVSLMLHVAASTGNERGMLLFYARSVNTASVLQKSTERIENVKLRHTVGVMLVGTRSVTCIVTSLPLVLFG